MPRTYRNLGNWTFEAIPNTVTDFVYRSIDIDHDGDEDLAPGYLNDGTGMLTRAAESWGLWWSFGDLDGDRFADTIYDGKVMYSTLGGRKLNEAPSVPGGLRATPEMNSITFEWSPSADDLTPQALLKYNLRVGVTPGGNELFSGVTPPYGPNVEHNLKWTLNIESANACRVYWSVQSQDGQYIRSAFAAEQTVFGVAGVCRDTTPPVFEGYPAVITVEATGPGATVANWTMPVALDDKDGVVPVVCDVQPGAPLPLGSTTVTCRAEDTLFNAAILSFRIAVVDTTRPVLVVPPVIGLDASSGDGAVVVFAVGAGDAVDPTPAVICTPASGSLFPTGTTQVTCTATDASGNTAGAAFSVTVRAPLSTDADVLTQIRALLDTTTNQEDRKKLEDAARHLQKAIDSQAWIDPLHLDAKKGEEVFQEHKNTVNKLRDLLKDKKSEIPDATLTRWIDRLVTASRVLATTAIEDQKAGDAKKIQKATEELAKGDEAAAQDDWGKAIEHYRNAWKHALDAVR